MKRIKNRTDVLSVGFLWLLDLHLYGLKLKTTEQVVYYLFYFRITISSVDILPDIIFLHRYPSIFPNIYIVVMEILYNQVEIGFDSKN